MKIAFSFKYFVAFIIIFAAILAIALFIESGFIRNHFGDLLIVLFVYCFIRVFVRNRLKWLWLYIFAFAVFIEVMQYWGLVFKLGLGDSQFTRVVIGVTFDWLDIGMYFSGCMIIFLHDKLRYKG